MVNLTISKESHYKLYEIRGRLKATSWDDLIAKLYKLIIEKEEVEGCRIVSSGEN